MTTDPDIIDQAAKVIRAHSTTEPPPHENTEVCCGECGEAISWRGLTAEQTYERSRRHLAQALADAGLLRDSDQQRNERMAAGAKVYADLEDARAERDELDAENQRLKAGNEALRQNVTDGDLVELKAEWKTCAEQLAAERDKAQAERNMAVGRVDDMRQQLAQVRAVVADLDAPNPEADQDWHDDPVGCIRDALHIALDGEAQS